MKRKKRRRGGGGRNDRTEWQQGLFFLKLPTGRSREKSRGVTKGRRERQQKLSFQNDSASASPRRLTCYSQDKIKMRKMIFFFEKKSPLKTKKIFFGLRMGPLLFCVL